MIGRQEDKLRRLYETYLDKVGIAKTMRRNLASDIEAGYSLSSVVKQMVKIEEYEATTVRKSEEEYRSYYESLGITEGELRALKRKWDEPFCKTLKYCSVGNRI